MASRNFYFIVIARVSLLTLTALGIGHLMANKGYLLLGILLAFLIGQVVSLIFFINSTNRKIAYFFDAIKNEDFTLRFPEKVAIRSFKELNQSLNRVNGLIQDVHLQLQIRENYYQEILKQANIGIMTFNRKGHILFANPTLEKLLNHSPLNHIKQLVQIDKGLYEIFERFEVFERKLFKLTNEREQKQLALKSTAMVLDKQQVLLVVVQDIHPELDEKETESWVRLIRVLTHEIMNTITPITSISDSILRNFKSVGSGSSPNLDDQKMQRSIKGLQVIKEQGGDLMTFVQSYRSFLSIPKPDRVLVPAAKLFARAALLTATEDTSTIHVIWENPKEDVQLFIDEKLIIQVLINLVKNAIQSVEQQENALVQISMGKSEEGKDYIAVKDNGPGIPKEVMDEIFVPFFTTKDKGTGIGLSLSRQIMQLHGGNLKVHSTPQRETIFVMQFQ